MRVLLVPNTANQRALEAAVELAAWLPAHGLEPTLVAADAAAAGLDSLSVSPAELGGPVLVVALGGDGTILKAVHVLGEVEAPVLGVNFGRLGFLSGARASNMREAIEATLAGDVRFERRVTLSAEVVMEGRSVGRYRALNEVFIGRGTSGRVIGIELAVDGRRVTRFNGDGAVVATSTGSTAYSLSAGGPIVAPDVNALVVTPVAPHSLAARPLVVSLSAVIDVTLPDPLRADACLSVDGDHVPCRKRIDRVTVTQGANDVVLARLDGRRFFDVVSEEFFGG